MLQAKNIQVIHLMSRYFVVSCERLVTSSKIPRSSCMKKSCIGFDKQWHVHEFITSFIYSMTVIYRKESRNSPQKKTDSLCSLLKCLILKNIKIIALPSEQYQQYFCFPGLSLCQIMRSYSHTILAVIWSRQIADVSDLNQWKLSVFHDSMYVGDRAIVLPDSINNIVPLYIPYWICSLVSIVCMFTAMGRRAHM